MRTWIAAAPGLVRLLGALALAAGISTETTAAVTYTVDRTVAQGKISGTIVTTGKTGVLAASDILDWNLTVDADGVPATVGKLLGPLSGGNSNLALTGMALTATPTELFYDFSVFFGFFQLVTPIPNAVWQMQAGPPFTDELIQESQVPLVQAYAFRGLVKERIATAASVPLEVTVDTTLTADHQGNVVIAADDVTLDCSGYTVRGGGTGIGIHLDGRTHVTVTRCVVTGFTEGVVVESSALSTITRNTVTKNTAAGIRLTSSDRNTLAGNIVSENAGGPLAANGIILSASSHNEIRFNTVTDTESSGIPVVDGSAWNTLIGNVSSHNGATGFDLIGVSNNWLSRNTAVGNGDGGFRVREGSRRNTLSENTACLNAPADVIEDRDRRGSGNAWANNLICTK